ncbi:MAG: molybdopterin-synthase adenylyltransferase MoeB [Chloroflexi bacterium]|nr:MAG: molybdopterin-synthase adenylyltransferase MoeB [Chloroflexota bacterium]RLT47427.1 MAG: molybdopterin-synthase adenylyltransferase MoeB [Chloroflexota bacterium]
MIRIPSAVDPATLVLSNEEIRRYSRHLIMPEVTLTGQQRLKAASVLCIGTGGLGSPVALYLAAAGVGRIGLVDYDVVESHNLQRQVIHGTAQIGVLKVESARQRLLDLNPDIEVITHNEIFSSANAMQLAQAYDILIDGTDNFPTRYLVNDVCVLLDKPNVYGSIFRFEGQVSVFWAKHGPCYRCLFPAPPPPGLVPSCAEGGVLGVLPGTVGTLQASEAIKLILGIGEPLIGRLLLYDALSMTMEEVKLRKNPDCVICGQHPTVTTLIDYEQFCGMPAHDQGALPTTSSVPELTVQELKAMLDANRPLRIIDVREPHEWQIVRLEQAKLIPLGDLQAHLSELDSTADHVVLCRSGARSAKAVELLLASGIKRVKNLKGGILAWAREVDTTLPLY